MTMSAPNTTDEARLLDAARAGDTDALETLLERYQPKVLRFGLRMCRDFADAEDVVQETLLAAARGLRTFRGGASLSTWLYTIARSYCIKKRRRSKFAPKYEASLDDEAKQEARRIPAPERSPEQSAMDNELQGALAEAIDSLEPMYKEVLLLRDMEGLTAPEVAQVVDASVSAVKSRLHRARGAVREALLPFLEAEIENTGPAGDCPDIVGLFSRNLEGEISESLCHQLQSHVNTCPRCRQKCDSITQVVNLCQAQPPPTVSASGRAALRAAVEACQSNNPTGSFK